MIGSKAGGALLAVFIAAFAGPAMAGANLVRATDGYVYFNRPGADMATHDSELRNCVETWQGGVLPVTGPVKPIIGGQGVVGDMIAGGVQGIMARGWDKARFAVNIEHCMIVRGWRLVRIPDAEGKTLAALDRSALTEALRPWIGAETPHGDIVRVWRNEAAMDDSLMGADPQGANQTLLSTLAMNLDPPEPPVRVGFLADSWLKNRNAFPQMPDGPIATVPDGMAVVLVRLTGAKSRALWFEPEGETTADAPYKSSFAISLYKAPKVNGRFERTMAFAIPPGRWRLFAMGLNFDFCLGAPAFDAKAGDVIYLGSFNNGPGQFKPDLDMAPATAFLGAGSPLAGQLKPAAWMNGSTSLCRSFHPYSLEFDGFPFEPGYVWGSAAKPAG